MIKSEYKYIYNLNFLAKISYIDRLYLARSIFLSVTIRISLMIFAYFIGHAIIKNNTAGFIHFIYDIVSRWDVLAFLFIAENGYVNFGDQKYYLVYLPLYPTLIYIFHYLFASYMAAALFINFIFSTISGYLLQKLVSIDFDDDIVKKTLYFFFLFPTSYFLIVPYTEPLFISLVLASLLFARKKKWFLASMMAMLCTNTKLQGIVIIPTLLIEFWNQRKEVDFRNILYLFIAPIGFLSYLFINWYVSNNPFEFLRMQKEHFFHESITPWNCILNTLQHIFTDKISETRIMIHETRLWAILISLTLLLFSIKKLRISYSFYSLSQLLILLTDSWLLSLPRYILAFFPMFISLAIISKNEYIYTFLLTISSFIMIGFYSLYISGYWAF